MKKILAALVTVTMMFSLAACGSGSVAPAATAAPTSTPAPTPIPTPYGDPLSTGTTADGLSYEVYHDCIRISECSFDTESVVIPAKIEGKPVTTIGSLAFGQRSAKITSIPESVTCLESGAFCACYGLTSIRIPKGVTRIEDSLFLGSSLISIDIPETVTSIGAEAFEECFYLRYIRIPKGVTSIGDSAFLYCENLTIYYAGTQEQWNRISIGCDAIPEGVTIQYNAT